MDFSEITPCGENCHNCGHKKNNECKGCLEAHGKCVKMWESDCYVFKCCEEHMVKFCGLCCDFPCNWLLEKGSWNPDIVAHQKKLALEYKLRKEN